MHLATVSMAQHVNLSNQQHANLVDGPSMVSQRQRCNRSLTRTADWITHKKTQQIHNARPGKPQQLKKQAPVQLMHTPTQAPSYAQHHALVAAVAAAVSGWRVPSRCVSSCHHLPTPS